MDHRDLPPISVVIPVFGREDVFKTLGLLKTTDYFGRLRIVVVDNGNAEPLAARLHQTEAGNVYVARMGENRGGSGGYIAGVSYAMKHHCDTRYIWLLDDDAVPNVETLPELYATFQELLEAGKRVASVGSVEVRLEDPDIILECGADFSFATDIKCRLQNESLMASANLTLKVTYTSGASGLLSKTAIEDCGFWDDVFIHYDDVEWGVRTTRMGYENFATTRSVVRHPAVGAISSSRRWISYYDTYNFLWICARYYKLGFLKTLTHALMLDVWHLYFRCVPNHDVYPMLARRDFLRGKRRLRAEMEMCARLLADELKSKGRLRG